jgi:hypothetical protein
MIGAAGQGVAIYTSAKTVWCIIARSSAALPAFHWKSTHPKI